MPDSFTIHRKLRKPLLSIDKLEQGEIEFGHAESLAFASLLTEEPTSASPARTPERGTFSQHRHLALHDEKTGLRYVPIQNLSGALAPFSSHNSPLSEAGCLGFEYGYSAASPESLMLWEAQFGDFASSAQVIIDSFIVAGESKWGQTTRLTLLLPTATRRRARALEREIERFIQLGSEGNIRLANPTTAAQYFHLPAPPGADRQAEAARRLHPEGPAAPAGRVLLARGADLGHVPVRPRRPALRRGPGQIDRLVLCSGKLFFDIDQHERRESATSGRARPRRLLLSVRAQRARAPDQRLYPNLKKIVWAQEEPKNMGAWSVMARDSPS